MKMQVNAGLHADVPTLTALCELGMPLSYIALNAVALSGRTDVLKHLLAKQQCAVPIKLSRYAARSGNLDMLRCLKTDSWCAFNCSTCAGAAEGGHLAVLKYVRSEGCEWDVASIACYAAKSGSIEAVEWLRQQQDIVIDAEVLAWAAGAGQTATCAHLRSTGCDWDTAACSEAALHGHLDTLRWLREHGCPWHVSDVCDNAAANGFPDVLDYVIEQGEVLDADVLTDALNWAGAFNRLETAQWLRQRGAEWPAVLGGGDDPELQPWRGESLAWARANGCTSPVSL
jgi:hypothetical protein